MIWFDIPGVSHDSVYFRRATIWGLHSVAPFDMSYNFSKRLIIEKRKSGERKEKRIRN